MVMTTDTGRQAILINSREATYGYDQRVEAFGSLGMAVSENRRPHHMVLSGSTFTEHAAPLLNFSSNATVRRSMRKSTPLSMPLKTAARLPSAIMTDGRRCSLPKQP